jgi:hypothetical protein
MVHCHGLTHPHDNFVPATSCGQHVKVILLDNMQAQTSTTAGTRIHHGKACVKSRPTLHTCAISLHMHGTCEDSTSIYTQDSVSKTVLVGPRSGHKPNAWVAAVHSDMFTL